MIALLRGITLHCWLLWTLRHDGRNLPRKTGATSSLIFAVTSLATLLLYGWMSAGLVALALFWISQQTTVIAVAYALLVMVEYAITLLLLLAIQQSFPFFLLPLLSGWKFVALIIFYRKLKLTKIV